MEENIKKFLKMVIYYNISINLESLEYAIRIFNFELGRLGCEKRLTILKQTHPSNKCYQDINLDDNEFKEMQTKSFVKMAMYQIEQKLQNWNFIDSDSKVEKMAEDINDIDISNLESFIKDNESLLKDESKYAFCFGILYRYLNLNSENVKDIKLMKSELELFSKSSFMPTEVKIDIEKEKFNYITDIYFRLTDFLHSNKEYNLAIEYYQEFIDYLERYIEKNNTFKANKYLATTYSNLGYAYIDRAQKIDDNSFDFILKAIDIRKKLCEKYPNKLNYLYECIARNYYNIAYEYKKLRLKYMRDEDKEKCLRYYNNSIEYREKLNEINEFKNEKERFDNYILIGKMYYITNSPENAILNYEKAIEVAQNAGENEWIEIAKEKLKKVKNI